MFEPTFKELEEDLKSLEPKVVIGYVDLVKNDELHGRFDIRHLPTLILF